MLDSARLMAFVATARPDEARGFYAGTLGLRLVEDSPYALVFEANGTMLRVQKVPEVTPAPFTALGWSVDDIEAAVRGLMARGVPFERFPGMEQDDLGIWDSGSSRVAWFKDPDGNLLSVSAASARPQERR